MMNEEMIAKAKEAKSVEELMALAKETGIELNEESAKAYFDRLHPETGEVSDDELSDVSGGGCETTVDGKKYTVVTNYCKCFTGQYLCNWKFDIKHGHSLMVYRTDHEDSRKSWHDNNLSQINKCGSCAHLGFKDGGLGYCEKS